MIWTGAKSQSISTQTNVLRISVGVLKMFRIPDDSRIICLCLLAYVTRTLETRERIKRMEQKLSSDKIDCIIISGETTAKWDVAKKKREKICDARTLAG